ncbi:MAG: MgtC/SapB family protein [Anaerolineae bacterium]|nr:MgtC/SapB family protein [Anaerolineae bacterium]MCO5191666.1 MgtC/SapB family protein [Anaerolineae bacterium]
MFDAQLTLLGIVFIATILGGVIGFDRELADKPAGLRTHMLVAATSALLVSLVNTIIPNLQIDTSLIRTDPIRTIEAVITGVTFLGAGTIIRNRSGVKGLTTAASLFFVAALGITVALEQFFLAVGLTILNLVVLRGVKWLEPFYS